MSKRQRLGAEERRERTVQTVVALCGDEEPAMLTTGRIAQRMGVTQGALFRHFPSKDAIWEAVVAWVTERVMARGGNAAEGVEDPLATLKAMFLAHVGFIDEHPGVPRLLLGQLQHARSTPAKSMVRSLLSAYCEQIEQLLTRAQLAGKLRQGLDIEAAAIQYIGTLQGLVLQSLIAGDVKRIVSLAPGAFDFYLRSIRADAGGES